MPQGILSKIGLVAVVLFAPGGFILGATLAARWWHRTRLERAAGPVA